MTAPRKQPDINPFDRTWASQYRLQCGDQVYWQSESYSGWYRVTRINRYDYVLEPYCVDGSPVLCNRLQLHVVIRDYGNALRDQGHVALELADRLAEPLRIL